MNSHGSNGRAPYTTAASFVRAAAQLQPQTRAQLDKALRLLSLDCRHPSLHVEVVRGTEGIRTCRVNRQLRLVFTMGREGIDILGVAPHDDAYRLCRTLVS